MLDELKEFEGEIEWEIPPTPKTYSRKSPEPTPRSEQLFIIRREVPKYHNVKKTINYLLFPKQFLKSYFTKDVYEIEILFNDDKLIFCFNPHEKDSNYKLINPSYLKNRNLINDIYEFFNLDKKINMYYLKPNFYKKIDDLDFYSITAHDFGTLKQIQ